MESSMPAYLVRAGVCVYLALVCLMVPTDAQAQTDGVATLLRRLEQAALSADREALAAIADPTIPSAPFEDFVNTLTTPKPNRVVAAERDRVATTAGTLRLVVEIFLERGTEGRLGTWEVEVHPVIGTSPLVWKIAAIGRLSVVTGLYRLSLNPATEYDIHDLTVRATDLQLHFPSGRAFLAETPEGETAMVILGRGRVRFSPPDLAERTQVRIFSGSEELAVEVDLVFLRFSPSDFQTLVNPASLRPRAAASADLRSASTAFADLVGRTLQIDLGDMSRDRWSLIPPTGDLIVELRTRKYGTLTYTRSESEPEDISVFDRKRRKNISVYASAEKLKERGRFYSEDDQIDYDVLDYDIDAQFTPERSVVEGVARIRLKVLADGVSTLTFKLAETLTVRSVYSQEFGRLLHLRIVGQNSIIANLPTFAQRGLELQITVAYAGPIAPQTFDREALQIGGTPQQQRDVIEIPLEQRFLYSNRSYWYPQSTVTDYATSRLRISVPGEYDVIATGNPDPSAAITGEPGQRRRRTFTFTALQPARYLAVVVSRFPTAITRRARTPNGEVPIHLRFTPRAPVRRDTEDRATAVFSFYAGLVGDAPYPSFTLGLLESEIPGGHSPPYFAVLNQVVPGTNLVWRNDPVSFDSYPSFYLAHELAHQWWGQAVGWKNYHEQWLSEGFAQYFAALYAEKEPEGNVLANVLRQMRHTAIEASRQGPLYLGYRLGHIQGDDRIFRAVVYNKGAMVLHMLRRFVGDEEFFAGVREFYTRWKFKKAGTDDFRAAMEHASGRNLQRFFDAWVFGSEIPRIKVGFHVNGTEAVIHFDQHGDPVDVPLTVTVTYVDGSSQNTLVVLSEKHTERTIALKGAVRSIVANGDNAALVEIEK
jgi:peptidase M1-like protein